MPHMILRVYKAIKRGDELLTDYTSAFWKPYAEDMRIANSLDAYHRVRVEAKAQ